MKRNCAFNYAGSKSNYPELFNIDDSLVDVFGGGGGLWSNAKSGDVVVNDVNPDIISFQKMLYDMSPEDFDKLVRKLQVITGGINSREEYETLRSKFNQTKDPVLFYCLLSTCTNNLIRYNLKGGFNQTWGQRKFNDSMKQKLHEFYNKIKQKNVSFLCGNFSDVPNYADRVYFVDPPYLITNAGYNTAWGEDNEQRLYRYLSGKRFVLTNYLKKGEVTNTYLDAFKEKYVWKVLRSGKMKSQKNDDEFLEIVVCSDDKLAKKVFGPQVTKLI